MVLPTFQERLTLFIRVVIYLKLFIISQIADGQVSWVNIDFFRKRHTF